MPSFPGSLPSFPTYVDLVDSVLAAHQNLPNDEIEAITAFLLDGALRQGDLINGYFERTVASNNLTVAIKATGGGNPSATNPVYIRIGASVRSITAALSVTINAGSSTFNAGSSELLGLEHDFFVYLGYRAVSATVFIAVSRIPYGRTYADFNSTATNEKYLAYSGSAPASTDEVENIGRFNAQNSGTASFNWSIPATSIVINKPTYEGRPLTFNSVKSSNVGSMVSVVVSFERYQVIGRNFKFDIGVAWQQNTTAADYIQLSLPFTPSLAPSFSGVMVGSGSPVSSNVTSSGNLLFVRRYDSGGGAFATGAGKDIRISYIASL